MDTENLIAHARARFDHVAAKRVLKEKYEARMLFALAGGMWRWAGGWSAAKMVA